jgi:hypothetical protein
MVVRRKAGMKKITIPQNFLRKFKTVYICGSALFFLIFASCNTLRIVSGMPFWAHGEYVNSSGVGLGKYFVDYEGEIPALFSNSAYNNEPTKIKGFRFSETDGITFSTPKVTAWYPMDATLVNLAVIHGDNEQHFTGIWNSTAIVLIPYSIELLNTLLENGTTIRLADNRRTYQFDLPNGFSEAWSKRTNKSNL